MINWDKYAPYITPQEVMCRCGKCDVSSAENVKPELLDTLLDLRLEVGKPFKFSSIYRCANHEAEIRKQSPGTHNMGMAADIKGVNDHAWEINKAAANHPKIKAIRFAQKGDHGSRFIHIDIYDRGFNHIGSY